MTAAEKQAPDRNLAMELVRVTEAAALAASRWTGRGDKEGADGAAVEAMRVILATVAMDGIVVIGEGEKDEAPMLYNGESIGDGLGAIATAWPDLDVDILFGIGGTPEGVIAAAALKCMDGEIQAKLWPRNDQERQAAVDEGYDLERVLATDDLVGGDNCFFAATGVTDGELLQGVHHDRRRATTQSLVMRSKSGTVRRIDARHRLSKLREYASIEFG